MRQDEPLGLHSIAREILASVIQTQDGLAIADGAVTHLADCLISLSGSEDFEHAVCAFVQIAAQLEMKGAGASAQTLLDIAELGLPHAHQQRKAKRKRAVEVLAASAERFRGFSGTAASASAPPVDTKASLQERSAQRRSFHLPVRG
jgi:hypothetical protein